MQRILPFLFLFLFLVAAAPAALIDYTLDPIDVPWTLANWDNTVSFQKFNIAGARLDSITFTLTGEARSTAQFENTSKESGSVDVGGTILARMRLFEPDGTTAIVIATPTYVVESRSLPTFDNNLDYGGTSGWTETTGTYTETKSKTYTDSKLPMFQGSGTITLPVTARQTNLFGSSGGSVSSIGSTEALAQLTITYTYELLPTPEPGVLAMVGSGLIGLGLLLRRRLRRA